MTQWLKQSTAATIKLGPFVDSTDGVTAETGLTISQADVRLSKNGGNMAQKNEASSATHDELGYYDVALDATDTATLGRLRVMVSESGALPVWQDFMVVSAATYYLVDGAGSDRPEVKLGDVAHGGTAATVTLRKVLVETSINGESAVTLIAGPSGAAGLKLVGNTFSSGLSVSAAGGAHAMQISHTGSGAGVYVANGIRSTDGIIDLSQCIGSCPANSVTAAALASDAVTEIWNAASPTNLTSDGELFQNQSGDAFAVANLIKAKTDNLPDTPAALGDAMTLAPNAVTAAALASDAVTEIASGILATNNGGDTVADQLARLDADVSSIDPGAIAIAVSNELGLVAPADLATEAVSKTLTFTPVPTSSGFRTEDRKTIISSASPNTYAIDMVNDAAVNKKVYAITSIDIISGTSGGITFGTPERNGGSQIHVRMTAATAGNYTVRVKGTYVGGAGFVADLLIKVVD